jgi:dipeptidyl aminopeptidase/acylaminoacyl peptidase
MKCNKITLSLILVMLFSTLYAQQPANTFFSQKTSIDTSTLGKWPKLSGLTISNDGSYGSYWIEGEPRGHSTSVVFKTNGKWEQNFTDATASLSDDNVFLIIRKGDTLRYINLKTSKTEVVTDIKFSQNMYSKNTPFIIFKTKANTEKLFIRNLKDSKEQQLDNVLQFYPFGKGDNLLLTTKAKDQSIQLGIFSLLTGQQKHIWTGTNIENLIFSEDKAQLCFQENKNNGVKYIWSYKSGNSVANPQVIHESSNLRIRKLDESGTRVFIDLADDTLLINPPETVKLNVWAYNDIQVPPKHQSKRHLAVVDLKTGRAVELGKSEDKEFRLLDDYWGIAMQQKNCDATQEYFIISTVNGGRKALHIPGYASFYGVNISPDGKYLIYFDPEAKNYFSYQINSGNKCSISNKIDWKNDRPDDDVFAQPRNQIIGWLTDHELLIYDAYDIWKADITGTSVSVNMTNAYGRQHHIELSLLSSTKDKRWILEAFNKQDKSSGFYLKDLSNNDNPSLLTMQQALFWHPYATIENSHGFRPIKAKNSDIYLLERMTAASAPDVLITNNFKQFTKVSDLHPERNYNWLTTELHTWKTKDHQELQGVLYKPENFDPHKKYPVIFYYYRKLSDNLNAFIQPDYSIGTLNIPWYVSNGYLVFTPDITFKLGQPGESALSAIESAADYVSKLPYVDSTKMGLQGHSFGGFETNYLITHSNRFAAACTASGLFDFVSSYNSINGGVLKQSQFEKGGAYMIGGTLWDNPDLYTKNSPIFNADKVTVPLLMMQTTDDNTVPLANSIEFFTALHRLDKKVWFLKYDGADHIVKGKQSEDFDLRMHQFFDHYLKGIPPPKWMTQSIPYAERQKDSGLELDTSGRQP